MKIYSSLKYLFSDSPARDGRITLLLLPPTPTHRCVTGPNYACTRPVMGKLFWEGAEEKRENFRRANINY
jgi:hypothetical protein